ncbi:hypothetical protein [Caldimonas sp. KR1-144]|uniref:hypothetical protein n=1 Tax=Caldimonas sp. KR1-144 TaxID=3400911 RepID=UPI003C0F71EB
MALKLNLTIEQGHTFQKVVRWQAPTLVYRAITGMARSGPARVTAIAHGIPEGWPVAVVDALGMTELNAGSQPPTGSDFRRATVVDEDTVEFNEVSSANFKVYKSGGYLVFHAPLDLTGFTARLVVKSKVGGEVLFEMTTENGRITINEGDRTITLDISAVETGALEWKAGVYDLDLIAPSGAITPLLAGAVTVTPHN